MDTKQHWSDIPELRERTKEIFNSLPPNTWHIHGWNGKQLYSEIDIDIADVHTIISEILRLEK